MSALHRLVQQLEGSRRFILYRRELIPEKPEKTNKVPCDCVTGYNIDAQDKSTWLSGAEAQMWADQWNATEKLPGVLGYGVGVVLNGDGLFCIDIDSCRDANGGWMPHAAAFCQQFPNALIEKSVSGNGLHIFGWARGVPAHGNKNRSYNMEAYTSGRFIALGDTETAQGWCGTDHTASFTEFLHRYFPPREDAADGDWTDKPVAEWSGPSDDAELIRRAERAQSGKSMTGNGASFSDLHHADKTDAVEKFYAGDESSADLAYFNHLSFWTGKDCERMERIALLSGLRRSKWDRDDYRRGTIMRACASQKSVYQGKGDDVTVPAATPSVMVDPYGALVDHTDQGNANLLILQSQGNLRYVAETKQWLRWDGRRWQLDEHEVFVSTAALGVARHYLDEAKRLRGSRLDLSEVAFNWAVKCRNKKSIDAMISLARKTEGVPISVTDLDRKAHLLGVENGVVDLRTGELRENEAREDYVTKRCTLPYKPDAKAPRWESLIAQVTGAPVPPERDANGQIIPATVGRFAPRPKLAHYIRKALGYSITGEVREQKFFVGIGDGSNGKGIVFDTTKAVVGPYAVVLPSDALMATKQGADAERPTALAASLAGTRFVVASESKEGQKLDVALIKAHTGDAEMKARRMRENPFTFAITHKIWLQTNVQPAIDHLDPATKGRLHLVPFDRRWNRPGEFDRNPALPDGDKGLMAELQAEHEGILAWLVQGAVLYYREGLEPPTEVTDKTRAFVREQDHVGQFMETLERCPAKLGSPGAMLFARFSAWCASEGYKTEMTQTAFGRALGSRNVEFLKGRDCNMWGLRVAIEAPPAPSA